MNIDIGLSRFHCISLKINMVLAVNQRVCSRTLLQMIEFLIELAGLEVITVVGILTFMSGKR